jgi:hypothetical protein
MRAAVVTLLIFLMLTPTLLVVPLEAQTQPSTLSETIYKVLTTMPNSSYTCSWGVLYSQLFSETNASNFDDSIQEALNNQNYLNVIFIKRLAELNDYNSSTITECTRVALQCFPMCGSLPRTYEGHNGTDPIVTSGFLLNNRFIINGYRYADELGVSGWNITTAFQDVTRLYLANGPYLVVNPSTNETFSASRYYDEYAQSLSLFLEFQFNGANATAYMDDAYLNIQTLWHQDTMSGLSYYPYKINDYTVEAEMGNFAQIIQTYRNFRGNISYFDRVAIDLETKLIVDGYNSLGWANTGVIVHSIENRQMRLPETLGVVIALQEMYPYFSSGTQTNLENMLPFGWQGLLNSGLYNNGVFANSGVTMDPDASWIGVMTLFLQGIVPRGGHLAFNSSEEGWADYRTVLHTDQWNFNYSNQTIKIPVIAGNLSFQYGRQEVSYNFTSNGVYYVQFSSDWNSILSVNKLAEVYVPILRQEVLLQTIPRPVTPSTKTTPTPTVSPSTSSMAGNPPETLTPTTTEPPAIQSQTVTPTPPVIKQDTDSENSSQTLMLSAFAFIAVGSVISTVFYIRRHRK